MSIYFEIKFHVLKIDNTNHVVQNNKQTDMVCITNDTVIVGNSPTAPGTLGIYQPLNSAWLTGEHVR